MGIHFRFDFRAVGDLIVRGVFFAIAIVLVFLHFGWQATMDERFEARADDDEIRRRLEAVGGETSESWNPELGYVATLIKPTNSLMVDLGTLGGKRCQPTKINDKGQIVGWSDNIRREGRGFVIDPRDVDGDDKLDWYQAGEGLRVNALMVDITQAPDKVGIISGTGARFPRHINDRGQIVGDHFCLTPRVIGDQPRSTWFVDDDGDGLNDLFVPLLDENVVALKGVKSSQSEFVFTRDLSRIISWTRKDSEAPMNKVIWQLDATGKVTLQRDLQESQSAESLIPDVLIQHQGDTRGTNAAGASIGRTGYGPRSACVVVPH